ncbi:MAG TPA: N-6 DNA methylase [Solirubrobacteraceae bacterium]|nr:N-6 DNA methylase [Solirubrobacteraceae bacterium]
MTSWLDLLEHARQLAPGKRDPIRLTNLAISVQAATAQERRGFRRRLDGRGLMDGVQRLALEPIVLEEGDRRAWDSLAEQARQAARRLTSRAGMDAWIEAFQGIDPARKSRGAYATPATLAAPMARLLLRGSEPPARVIDPAAGAGSLLVAVLRELRRTSKDARELRDHTYRLHGVELDPVARELCCLQIWLSSTGSDARLQSIARRVRVGNALTTDWWASDSYDALIMNPPWDSLRHSQSSDHASDLERDATVGRLVAQLPGCPSLPPLFTAQGRGDRNLYKAFIELAPHLTRVGARLVMLIPGAWSSDLGTQQLRRRYLEQLDVEQWTSFENLRGYFPIDGRYKFGVLAGTRALEGTRLLPARGFAANASDLRRAHVAIDVADLRRIGGVTAIIPDLTSRAELRLMLRYHRHGAGFFEPNGPLGSVAYTREVDLTEDRKRALFRRFEDVDATSLGDGRWRAGDGRALVPLIEGRMVGPYDFHQKSWVAGSGRTANWSYANGNRLGECRPQFLIEPTGERSHRVAFCDITSATNTRTVLATWVPSGWRCGNTAPVLVFESERQALAALAVLNSMVFDWLVRRLVAGLHLNRFYLEALSWPLLDCGQVDALASAGSVLQRSSPRYRGLAGPRIETKPAELGYVDTHALIETTVASGYRLSVSELKRIFETRTDDRRGFWRHFNSDPHAQPIAEAAVELLADKHIGARLAVGKGA